MTPFFSLPHSCGFALAMAMTPGWRIGFEGVALATAVWLGWRWGRRQPAAVSSPAAAAEERFRALFETAVEGVYERLPEGGFARANLALARMLGFSSEAELVKIPPAETWRIYTAPGRREEFFAALGSGDHLVNFESEIRRPDGSTTWIKENVRAVRDTSGRLLFLQGFVSDVAARKQAEAALRASEERFRVLFEHSPIGMLECDYRVSVAWAAGLRERGVSDLAPWLEAHPDEAREILRHVEIVGANAAAFALMGTTTLAQTQANLTRIMTEETLGARREMLLAVWHGRHESEGEFALRSLDGGVKRVFYHWWTPEIDGRPSFERTQIALVDLTVTRRTEDALAAERERLSVTLRAMSEAVLTSDFTGKVQFMNEAASRLTGWPEAAAVGKPLAEICGLRSGTTWVTTATTMALAGNAPLDLPPQSKLHPRSGPPRLVEGQCAPIHDATTGAIGTVLVLRDVTESSRLEAELLRASKLQSVGVLAGGIAHDFNNLLSIVMGNLTLALLDEKTAAAGGRWLREAERGTLRAKDLTQQLLTFAKGGDPVRTAVALSDVVREAAEFALHGATVKCEFDISPDLRPADVDKGQIGQVVQNLIINAMQAMPGGGIVRLQLRNDTLTAGAVPPLPAGDYLRLEISDTGKGIAPEHLAHIFEPFFTTKEQGSGLGLATVYSVVQKHSGHVTAESAVGVGTTFRVWLPAARAEVRRPAPPANPFDPIRGRVLFMDDEEPIRVMTKMLLERLGLEAMVTADGGEAVRQYALARMTGKPFDLVIMDLTVPGAMGGADAMREILKIDPQARGIVSSGYSSDPVMANFRAHGFRGMVPKPYRVADFSAIIREVLASTS